MLPPRPTDLVHSLLRDHVQPGDTVVDATAGNGHDTVFLAQAVGPKGHVIAYDIQAQAIRATQAAVTEAGCADQVTLHQRSHVEMAHDLVPESASTIVFNLGYLPGEDHQVTTEAAATLKALEAARNTLAAGGLLAVVCYPGHEQGRDEAWQVESWMTALTSSRWRVAKYAMLGTKNPAPFLLLACKPITNNQ